MPGHMCYKLADYYGWSSEITELAAKVVRLQLLVCYHEFGTCMHLLVGVQNWCLGAA